MLGLFNGYLIVLYFFFMLNIDRVDIKKFYLVFVFI